MLERGDELLLRDVIVHCGIYNLTSKEHYRVHVFVELMDETVEIRCNTVRSKILDSSFAYKNTDKKC